MRKKSRLLLAAALMAGGCSEWNHFWYETGAFIDDNIVDPLFNDRWFTSENNGGGDEPEEAEDIVYTFDPVDGREPWQVVISLDEKYFRLPGSERE